MKPVVLLAVAIMIAAPEISVSATRPKVCAACLKANMAFLAAPALRGRACGTSDENAAARFVADRLQASGVQGALPGGAYLQPVQFRTPTYAAPPTLTVADLVLTQGREIVALNPAEDIAAPLAVVGAGAVDSAAGKVVIYDGPYDRSAIEALSKAGAAAVVATAPERTLQAWGELADRPPGRVEVLGAEPAPATPRASPTLMLARPEALARLKALEGRAARFAAPRGEPLVQTTYNVLGVIRGTARHADSQAVLLSAHYDHVGVRRGVVHPGANDDASGTAAVLEFARLLAAGKPPRRTVYFALFGCEEEGGHGAKYFLAHPPTPLASIVANLEFEMIGVPDPADRKALMLTGWERTTLGPALRARGASIGPDRYPAENFFQRSDNYQLAKKGVVAQTISAWPVPPTYHQPTDTLENVDLDFMAEVIQSLIRPIRWLLNSDFRPEWNPGGRP